jgi:hypothetical protein
MRALIVVMVVAGAAHADRPAIELAAVAPPTLNGKPWPLAELPSLQPHLDLAMAHDACTPAAAQRARDDDVRAYLAAWCRIRAGERDAVDALAPVVKQAHGEVAYAALLDIVDLIADLEDPKAAVAHLERLGLRQTAKIGLRRAAVLDLLAATYAALGMRGDALAIGRLVMRSDTSAAPEVECERTLAWLPLDEAALASFAEDMGPCGRRAVALRCALVRAVGTGNVGARLVAMRECFVALPDDPERDSKLGVILAFARWELAKSGDDWLGLARVAEAALPVHGAEALAVRALENARAASCGREDEIADAAARLAAADLHDAAFDARLRELRRRAPCANK